MKKVIILRGLPGSGKSTWASRLAGPACRVCSADDYFLATGEYVFNPASIGKAHQWCFRRFLEGLTDSELSTLVVDNTNVHVWEMSPYVLAAEAHGASVEIVEIRRGFMSVEDLARSTVHGVSLATIERMATNWETCLPWWTVRQVDVAEALR